MKKFLKGMVSFFLVVVIVLGAMPLSGLSEIEILKSEKLGKAFVAIQEFFEGFSPKAEAATMSENAYKIVLRWGSAPRDLDSHVEGTLSDGTSFHCYYGNKNIYDDGTLVVNLDTDDTSGYGPEKITIDPSVFNGDFTYYIYNFTGTGSIPASGASVSLYKGDVLIDSYNASGSSSGRYWTLFKVKDGTIYLVNSIGSDVSNSTGTPAFFVEDEYNVIKKYEDNQYDSSYGDDPIDPSQILNNISLESTTVDGPSINILGTDVKLFSVDLGMDLPIGNVGFKTYYDKNKQTYKMTIGNKGTVSVKDSDQDEFFEEYENFKKFFNVSNKKQSYKQRQYYKKIQGLLDKTPGLAGVDADMQVCGFLEFDVSQKPYRVIETGITVMADVAYSADYPFWYVFYATFTLGVEAGVDLAYTSSSSGSFSMKNFYGQFTLAPHIGLGVGGKVLSKKIASLEAGIEGKLEMVFKIPVSSGSFTGTLKGNAYVKGNLFTADFNKPIPFGDGIQLWPKQSVSTFSLYNDTSVAEINFDDFQLNDREYLSYRFSTFSSGESSALLNDEKSICSIYPYACPKIVALDNGTQIAVWLDDDGSKNAANLTTLYYMFFDGAAWSDPMPVCETKCADFEAELYSDGTNVYATYLRATKELSEENFSVEDFAGNLELVYTKFDGENWMTPISVTKQNVISDYSLVQNDNIVYISWVENVENEIISSNSNNVYAVKLFDNSFSNPELIASNIGSADSFSVGMLQDELAVMYCVDGVLYKNGEVFYNNVCSNVSYQNNAFYFVEDNQLIKVEESSFLNTGVFVFGGYKILTNGTDYAVIYCVENNLKNELYISYFNTEKTLPILSTEKSINSFDAFLSDDAKIVLLTAEETVYDFSEEDIPQLTDLVIRKTDGYVDLELDSYAICDAESIIPDNTVLFETTLKNNGMKKAEGYVLSLIDNDGNVLQSKTVEDVVLAGETKDIYIEYKLPLEITRTSLKLEVTTPEETITDNNTSSIEYGYSDVLVESYSCENNTINANVKNVGYDIAENVVLTIKQLIGDNEYEEVTVYDIGNINPQGTQSVSINIEEYVSNFINNSEDEIYIVVELTSDTEELTTANNIVALDRFSIYTRDSNSDGIPDYWFEHCALTDSNTIADEDYDEDGLTNYQEYMFDTNPCNPDEDGDNVYDGIEIFNNLDPFDAETTDGIDDYTYIYGVPDAYVDINSFVVDSESGNVSVSIVNNSTGKAMRTKICLYVANEIIETNIVNLNSNSTVEYTFSKDYLVDGLRIVLDEDRITRDSDYSNNEFIYIPATGISTQDKSITITKGTSKQLEYELTPETASQIVFWGTSNETVATIDNCGLVTSGTIGKTVITATTPSGYTCKYNLIVEPFSGAGETDFDCRLINNNTEIEIIGYYGDDLNVTIPDSIGGYPVTSIDNLAFNECEIESITISSNVSSIGQTAFNGISKLKSIEVDENNLNFSSKSGVLYDKNQTVIMRYPYANEATTFTVPNTVCDIAVNAFNGATLLQSVDIPESVLTINANSFANSNLTNINYAGSKRVWKTVSVASNSGLSGIAVVYGKYTASFSSEGVVFSQTDYKPGETIKIPDDIPDKVYYSFVEWSPSVPDVMPESDLEFSAVWEVSETTRKVEYYVDGELYWSDYRYAGEVVTLPDTIPTKTGYTFLKWTPDIAETMPDENIVYEAVWTINSHQVSFVVDEETYYSYECEYSSTLIIPDNPTKEGYTFVDWSPAFPETMPDMDLTFTAVFEPITYTATFMNGDEIIGTDEFIVSDETLDYPVIEEKSGYEWVWDQYEIIANNITVNGEYVIITYTVTFNVDGEIIGEQQFTVENPEITAPDIPQREGYTAEWEEYEGILSNLTINAIYTPIIYTATFMHGDETIGTDEFTVEDTILDYPEITAKEHYDWVWDDYEIIADNITVTGGYVPTTYRASFVADGVTVEEVEFNVENQSVVAPEIPEKAGYTAAWESYEINLADFTVNAVYTPIVYTATFTHNGKVIGTDEFTVEDSALNYPEIEAKEYYEWIWDEHEIIDNDITVNGEYVPITYTIKFVSNGKTVKTQSFTVETVDTVTPPSFSLPSKAGYYSEWEEWEGKICNLTVNEVYVPIKYTASFYCDNILVMSRTFTVETKIEQLPTPKAPTRVGYYAVWDEYSIVARDIEIHARYVPIEYTAQFIADGVVVSTQKFTVETESLDEPDVPQKAGYVARWSGYKIEAKDISIVAKYHLPEVVTVSKLTLDAGETFRLLPSCNFEVTEKSWSSSDTSVATVNQHGKVTAVGKGECEITITCYGKDSLSNDIQASKATKIIVNDKSEPQNFKQSFREMFNEFFEVTLYDLLYNLREFMIVLFKYVW